MLISPCVISFEGKRTYTGDEKMVRGELLIIIRSLSDFWSMLGRQAVLVIVQSIRRLVDS